MRSICWVDRGCKIVRFEGHACPILYAAWEEAGHLTHEQVLSLRKITSDLEGHPTPRLDFIDVATGSLGQGLSCAAGMAYVGKYIDKVGFEWCCCNLWLIACWCDVIFVYSCMNSLCFDWSNRVSSRTKREWVYDSISILEGNLRIDIGFAYRRSFQHLY